MTAQLAVGVTVGLRGESYLSRTLSSLRVPAGAVIHGFFEPGAHVPEPPDERVEIHQNQVRLGNWFNWLQMVKWLLAHTDTPFLMTIEDDVVFAADAVTDTLALFRKLDLQTTGFVSLYKSGQLRRLQTTADVHCLRVLPPGRPWGACAWMFPRKSLIRLVNHPVVREWRGTRPELCPEPQFVDGVDYAIADACHALQLNLFVQSPSLAQHIGAASAVGNNQGLVPGRTAPDFQE